VTHMDAPEQKLLDELKEANVDLKNARGAFADAKRRLVDAESGVINAKLRVERLTEDLRKLRVQQVVPGQHYALFDDDDGG
jgi:predicted  nucleic acid-binding Zn-ribbon protein